MWYHATAASFSHGIFFLTFHQLIVSDMSLTLAVPYVIGTVSGSVVGAKVSMYFEVLIGATADGHVR